MTLDRETKMGIIIIGTAFLLFSATYLYTTVKYEFDATERYEYVPRYQYVIPHEVYIHNDVIEVHGDFKVYEDNKTRILYLHALDDVGQDIQFQMLYMHLNKVKNTPLIIAGLIKSGWETNHIMPVVIAKTDSSQDFDPDRRYIAYRNIYDKIEGRTTMQSGIVGEPADY